MLRFSLILMVFVLGSLSCHYKKAHCGLNPIEKIDAAFKAGNFNDASECIDSLLADSTIQREIRARLEWKQELMRRIRLEFKLSKQEVIAQLKPFFPELTGEQLQHWEDAGTLEMRIIDGQPRYFKRAVSNLFLLDSVAARIKAEKDGPPTDAIHNFQQRYIPPFFKENQPPCGEPFDIRTLRLNYSITLPANVVPAGERVRCWMPYPQQNGVRQRAVRVLKTSDPYILAPERQAQRSLYMEKTARPDTAICFEMELEIETAAIWFDLDPAQVKPYDVNGSLFAKYTAERPPHIVFNEEVKQLALDIVGEETNPMLQVRALFNWMNDHIPWAGALEYSVMESIPAYVLKHRRGDCGMQTFLFLSMARSLGIPARWESGWYLMPEEVNLHDWAEVYFEGIGWVPIDPSFKLVNHDNPLVREFYLGGMDSYRFIVNSDFGQPLYPAKVYPRSEPFDFQRGELEWRGGNLYFDQWNYQMEVEWLD